MMRIVLADAMGWCFGVRDAVSLALNHPHRRDLTIVGELVHDRTVLGVLRAAGIRFVRSADDPIATRHALITAHGASRRTVEDLRRRGLVVEEATCPLVRRVKDHLDRFVEQGLHPVVVGRRDHVEVVGLIGDFADVSVIAGPEDVAVLPPRSGYGLAAQTTEVVANVLDCYAALRRRRPGARVELADTVCKPTRDRQLAVRRLAAQVDRVVVVGGPDSHNTARLARTCRAMGTPADRVQRADELDPDQYRGLARVGVTAGTSCPDEAIAAVTAWLTGLGAEQVA